VSTVFNVNNILDDGDSLKREAEEMVADVFRGEVVRAESESPPVIYNKRFPIYFLIIINQCCILAPRKAQTTSN
jgi:hypothetical protein